MEEINDRVKTIEGATLALTMLGGAAAFYVPLKDANYLGDTPLAAPWIFLVSVCITAILVLLCTKWRSKKWLWDSSYI